MHLIVRVLYTSQCTLECILSFPAGEVMVSQGEAAAIFTNVVNGHHVYKAVWTPQIGEHLTGCSRRATNTINMLSNVE